MARLMVKVIAITVVIAPLAVARSQESPPVEEPDPQQQQPDEFYPEDPAIELANAASERIAREERELDALMAEFLRAVEETPLDTLDLEQEAITADLMRRVARGMVAQGKEIIDHWQDMTSQAERLKKALVSAPERFRAAAEVFKGYAEDEEYEDLSALYLDTAAMFEGKADLAVQEQESLDALTDNDLVTYVEHVTLYYERLIPALAYADDVSVASKHDAFIARLQSFKERHQQLEEAVRTLRDKALGENAFDEGIREKNKADEVPDAPDAPVTPTVTHGYDVIPNFQPQTAHFYTDPDVMRRTGRIRTAEPLEEGQEFWIVHKQSGQRVSLVTVLGRRGPDVHISRKDGGIITVGLEAQVPATIPIREDPIGQFISAHESARVLGLIRDEQAASYAQEQGERPTLRFASREQAP